jgi:hypothetical protein
VEEEMPDDRKNIGEPDRSRVSVSEDFEVEYFAKEHRLSIEQVRELIRKFGNDREKLEAAAKATRRE